MTDQQTGETTDPEAERVETLDARFGRIEAEQAEHKTMLGQILAKVGGETKKAEGEAHADAQQHTEEHLERGSTIADQVRAAVEAVGAEKAQKEADEQHAKDHAALREAREKPPRESQSGFRGRLQRAMYGGDPS